MLKRTLFAVWLLPFAQGVQAQKPCLKYEPEVVELSGRMEREAFPGPPNYADIKQGDRPETYWILYLPKPICVERTINTPNLEGPSEYGISKIQLIQVNYEKYRKLLGKTVRVRGSLTHAITGHHHTPVMLEVLSIKPAT